MNISLKYFVCFYLVVAGRVCYGQYEASKWYFGNNAALDFMSSPPAILNNSALSSAEGCASVADAAGNLLFYTDGNTVKNKLHATMANGAGITGGSASQSVLIAKQPGPAATYYLFTVLGPNAYYSIIDMTLAAGMGSVTVKNAVLAAGIYPTYKIAGALHCNGSDVWVACQQQGTAVFQAYLLSAAGINTTPVISSTGSNNNVFACMKFSPSGRRLAYSNYGASFELFDFNRTTGVLSNHLSIGSVGGGAWGVEFSPDETKLYGTRTGNLQIWQWNLCAGSATAITASQYAVTVTGVQKGAIQLGPDGKIYIARDVTQALGVINNPNIAGAACNYVEAGQSLAPNYSSHGIPNFISSYFYHPQGPAPYTYTLNPNFNCNTVAFAAPANPTVNCAGSGYSVTGMAWQFNDPASGSANTSTLTNPVHVYATTGTYTPQLIFYYDCGSDTLRQTITVYNGPTLTVSGSSLTCAHPGSATVNISGGTGPYSYTWSPSALSGTAAANLATGVYSVSVYDSGASCSVVATTTINSSLVFTGTVSSTNLLCNGINTGSAAIDVSGGTGSYTYTWSGSAQTTSVITGLSAGLYTVTVSDVTGPCSLTKTLQVTQPPVLTLTTTASSLTTCVGGTITLSAGSGGGTPAYTYSWAVGPQSPTYAVAETAAGNYTYTVTATDANTCSATATIGLHFSNAPLLTVSGATICSGYTATLNISGATSYTWHPTNFVGSTFTDNPVTTTVYSIAAIAAGCTSTNLATATISVVSPPSLTIALSSNTLCSQAFNGSPNTITLTSSGASAYTLSTPYHIQNPNPGGPASALTSVPPYVAGLATATLQGSNGVCTVSTTVNFSIIPNPTVSISSPTPIICAGQSYTYTNSGASSYTWTPGVPGLTTYSSGQVAVTNPSINSVFSVFGGSLGCNSAIQTSTLTVQPLPVFSITPVTPTICAGNVINLTASGTAMNYTWSPPTGLNTTIGANVNAGPPSTQSYTVTGALNSCTNSAMVTVSVLPAPAPSLTVSKSQVCMNETVTLQGFGGLSYTWYDPTSHLYTGQTITFVAGSTAMGGIYTLTAVDYYGCTASATIPIGVYNLPNGNLSGRMSNCVPFCSDFKFYTSANSSSFVTSSWLVGTNHYNGKNFSACFTQAGSYAITGLFKDTVTGCINTATFTVEGYPAPVAGFNYLPAKPVENLDEVIFTNTSQGTDLKSFSWSFINNNGYSSESEHTSYLFTDAGVYPVVMVVKNKWGCADTIIKSIQIEPDFNVFVPNTFTPNDDGRNDVFIPVVRGVKTYNLALFDRWGEKVFETSEVSHGWNGIFRSEPCKTDVYVWKINLSALNGESKTLAGQVTLLR